jgi:hypothetical protein
MATDWAASTAWTLDDGAVSRRRRSVATDWAASTAWTLDDGALATGRTRAMPGGRHAAGRGRHAARGGRQAAVKRTATSERRAFLAEDVAVRRPGASSTGRGDAAVSAGHGAGARSGECGPTAMSAGRDAAAWSTLGAHTGPACTGEGRLRGRVTAHRGAVAGQAIATSADAQPRAAADAQRCPTSAGLPSHADTP